MNSPLPFLISIPHGGTERPSELKGRIVLSAHDQFDDSDVFTQEIYDVGDVVVKVLKSNIARAFVDMSRSPQQMPPEFPDGLIKNSTCLRKPIYAKGKAPDDALRKQLIKNYYEPYHNELQIWSRYSPIKLGFDCHSMLHVAPDISPDRGQERPLVNLGNLDGKACPQKIVEILADSFCTVFNLSKESVSLNRPFKGGYITQKYANKPIPWIQIEINRILYLHEKWFDRDTLKIDNSRLKKLNNLFACLLKLFYKRVNHTFPEFFA